mmetsp:Transcript_6721/g.11827  ORF Transcript_6721/g.11827 Transcript_6721/m.11827 type:complete len:104 (-) Transcript_6721:158-469(-)
MPPGPKTCSPVPSLLVHTNKQSKPDGCQAHSPRPGGTRRSQVMARFEWRKHTPLPLGQADEAGEAVQAAHGARDAFLCSQREKCSPTLSHANATCQLAPKIVS